MEMLQVLDTPTYDDSVFRKEKQTIHPNNPLALSHNDIIHFSMNQSDSLIYLPESHFILEGRLTNKDGTEKPKKTNLTNGGVLHLFDRAELRINNKSIELVNKPGLLCIPKIYSILSKGDATRLEAMGWKDSKGIMDSKGNFTALIPFSILFATGFDFKQVLINTSIEVLLTRARNDNDAIISTENEDVKINLTKCVWKLPFVSVNDVERLRFLKLVEKDEALKIIFRGWELYQNPQLMTSAKQTWNIKTSNMTEKPRYVIFFFQTNRNDNPLKSSSEFDHCNLRNIKLILNNDSFPQEDLDQNVTTKFNEFYDMYCALYQKFSESNIDPQLSYEQFKKSPLYIIDCSHQNENPRSGACSIRVEFECGSDIEAGTSANCIIIRDCIYEYTPLSGSMQVIQ